MGVRVSKKVGDPEDNASNGLKKWRIDGLGQWNKKACWNLESSIMKWMKLLEPLKQTEIIVCGGTGHGKSSLINNCLAALNGTYSVVAQVSSGEEQVTLKYTGVPAWKMDDGSEKKLPLVFYDTRGLSDSTEKGASVAAIKACIMGRVEHGETIDLNITDEDWDKRTSIKEKASYIFFVADATDIPTRYTPYEKMKTIYQNLHQISAFAKKEGIQVAAFVTKCDRLDSEVKGKTSMLHYSTNVECKVNVFSNMVDVTVNRVFPVVNYAEQLTVSNEMKIQTLLALKACLNDIVPSKLDAIQTQLKNSDS